MYCTKQTVHRKATLSKSMAGRLLMMRFFYFFIFHFRFLQKYIFVFKIYRNIPGRPAVGRPGPGCPAAGRQGLFCKNFREEFALRPLEDRSPRSGAAGPQAARQRGCRLPLHYLRVGCPPPHHPSFASLKFQKKEKRGREGERRSPAGFSNWRLQVIKKFLRFTNSLCCNYFC